MVTKEELRKRYKLKVMLKGPSGTGKTFSSVKIANNVASRGWKVLYLDRDRGADEELEKLDESTLENIIHEYYVDYKSVMDYIKDNREKYKDKLKLIIVDPMPLIEIARLSARDAFLDQGYYWVGEKKVEIDNKSTFDLRGFMYQLSTTYMMKLLDTIVTCEQDIVCTLKTPNKNETEYDGTFSIVFETFNAWVGNNIYYKAIPKKFRGVDLSTMPAIDNPYVKLLEGFRKKYDVIGKPAKEEKVEEKEEEDKETLLGDVAKEKNKDITKEKEIENIQQI